MHFLLQVASSAAVAGGCGNWMLTELSHSLVTKLFPLCCVCVCVCVCVCARVCVCAHVYMYVVSFESTCTREVNVQMCYNYYL